MAQPTFIRLTDCPRDAMQGIHDFIPTVEKRNLVMASLSVGFPVVDSLSFVSPKAIPQMKDAKDLIKELNHKGASEVLAIVANVRGTTDAADYEQVNQVGYPLSMSETFQQRNTNRSIAAAKEDLKEIMKVCKDSGKKLVVYLSMAFGNPYGDDYSEEIVIAFAKEMETLGVHKIALSDTVGNGKKETIAKLFSLAKQEITSTHLGLHLHAKPEDVEDKLAAGIEAGCQEFDGALLGIGGCPMAEDELVGNMDTYVMAHYLENNGFAHGLDLEKLDEAKFTASRIFGRYS